MKGWMAKTHLAAAIVLLAGLAWAQALGTTKVALDARDAQVRTRETAMGDLVADAARGAVRADLALVQASLFRSRLIPAGELTRQALESALVYPEEPVVLVEMSGGQVLAALEHSLSSLPRPSTGFLQVSGLRVDFRSDAPAGRRVAGVRVAGRPLAPEGVYRVAMARSLAKGALGYFRIFNGLEPRAEGPALGQALADHVRALGQVDITAGGRLRDLAAPPAEP